MARYAGPIVDAHHHLWDRSMDRHPWLRDKAGTVLEHDCLPADYLRATQGFDVVASVHVEANWDPADPLGEVNWLASLPRPKGIAARHVAHADLGRADVGDTLDRLAAQGWVVGIRDIVAWHPDPARSAVSDRHRMADPAWRAGLARLAPLGLSFDLSLSPWQIDDALALTRDFPDTRIAINHCGSPFDRSVEGLAAWERGLHRLAERPNVVLKVSDLVAYDPDWTEESLAHVSRSCLDAFGPARCLLGSDHPVVGLGATFAQAYGHFTRVFADLGDDAQYAMFAGNAAEFYRLPHPTR